MEIFVFFFIGTETGIMPPPSLSSPFPASPHLVSCSRCFFPQQRMDDFPIFLVYPFGPMSLRGLEDLRFSYGVTFHSRLLSFIRRTGPRPSRAFVRELLPQAKNCSPTNLLPFPTDYSISTIWEFFFFFAT